MAFDLLIKARDMPRVFIKFKGKFAFFNKEDDKNDYQTFVILYSFGTNLH